MSLPAVMLAAVARREGGPGALVIEELPRPDPGPGQVLIRVDAAAVNFSDVKRRRGDAYPFATRFPFVPGGEVSGTVAALGPGVEGWAEGDAVFGLVGGDGQGGYAQFALAYAAQLGRRPPSIDADRASTLTVAGSTALLLLREAGRLQRGESVLVPAATGGVGSYLVPLAGHMGAGQVIAAVGGTGKAATAISLGATAVVDTTQGDWAAQVRELTAGHGVDLLLESAGGPSLAQGLGALAPFGRAIVYGAASGQDARLEAEALRAFFYAPAPNQSLSAFNLGCWFIERPQVAGAALGELVGLVARGELQPPAVLALPLSQAADAHRRLESRATSGKIVLKPWIQ
jgi:NADPH:quinone reductase-like Zn-dependent oxidoreductase